MYKVVLFTLLLLGLPALANRGPAAIDHTIDLDDPERVLGKDQGLFLENLKAAVTEWGKYIDGRGTLRILVKVFPSGVGRIDGASLTNIQIGKVKNRILLREGAVHKLVTGKFVDSQKHDILIRVSPQYLKEKVWIDPKPFERNLPVPSDRVDLVSVFTHELGHGFGINSFRHLETGELPPGFIGHFDSWLEQRGSRLYFVGKHAVSAHGSPLPITSKIPSQRYAHFCDPEDPEALREGLMNGVSFNYGKRYPIKPVDVAILKDLGLPVSGG